ncbi:hypothetical protein KI809_16635 [Geobacter pelophilus]|uniref:Uncharacterized protein n=1 Tax=Geoanaerobacter pelophilus TaxID=60036 RepID=A0AAW4L584_9BACT|nr:hypothetical protein [Geoanaerobacter pelophilus]MBT0665939.1 hypothetical protein [Geoanaerobacter pelophilus]
MKAYLFDTETGLFEGESFADVAMLNNEDGITTVAPPEYEHGQVPIFDRRKNEWTVIPINIAKQLLNKRTIEITEKAQ